MWLMWCRMSLAESLAAATINAAHSLGRGSSHGSIEVGKVERQCHNGYYDIIQGGPVFRIRIQIQVDPGFSAD